MTYVKWRKAWRISSAVYLYIYELCSFSNLSVTSSLHLRHNSFSNPSVVLPTSQLTLQSFRCFTYTSQFILQPFFRFSYVTSSSLNSPGKPSMLRIICVVGSVNTCKLQFSTVAQRITVVKCSFDVKNYAELQRVFRERSLSQTSVYGSSCSTVS